MELAVQDKKLKKNLNLKKKTAYESSAMIDMNKYV